MSISVIKTSFVVGEVSPAMFGHVDLARMQGAASTMRNMWPSFHGGAYSRAGTAFVGFSRQTGRALPPRMIPFQFSINQGLALEFGNFYMRVIDDGGFVLNDPGAISGASRTNPCVLNVAAAIGATTATPHNGGVVSSYNSGDTVTLKGGSYSAPAVLTVQNTLLLDVGVAAPGGATGHSYAPGDTITLAGGVQVTAPTVTVFRTQVVAAVINNAGSGGANGSAIVTGTTGTGTRFKASVTIDNVGKITSIDAITVAGEYSVNPTSPEPVSGGGLTGATFDLVMGVLSVTLTTGGQFTTNPSDGRLTQSATSGAGTGATFQNSLFGIGAAGVLAAGIYDTFPPDPVAQASSSGHGEGATFDLTTGAVPRFIDGDWIVVSDVGGMTEINGGTFVVHGVTLGSVSLYDVYGNTVDATGFDAYAGGGEAASIYTLATPYSDADLQWLKFTQSADVMTICDVNQQTRAEYVPLDLARLANNNWEFRSIVEDAPAQPPATITVTASDDGDVTYQYVVTAVSSDDGTESVASTIGQCASAVDIAATAGTITVTWAGVAGINQYNIYKASPGYGTAPPVGALFGYAGSAFGTQFLDSNIVADFTQVPPLHKNPFAPGQVLSVSAATGGNGYTTAQAIVNTVTGTDAKVRPVVVGGAVVAYIIDDAGSGYADGDTVTVTGDGTGATASATIGPQTGTNPSAVGYFQQRRVFANTLNSPDTYFMSQPGAYTNFDSRVPPIDSDAIIGSPWSVQVNGIQFLQPMPGGLVAFTGLSVWQLNGGGSSSFAPQPITPSSQSAQPQSSIGCSATVPPIKIESDIIYVQAKDSNYLEATYQIYTNNYIVNYLTLYSSHLFAGYTIREHAWCEEPYKMLWSTRNDGVALSLTRLKSQEIQGWARHDTQGLFQSVCQVTEPPVDALYLAVQRFPPLLSGGQNSYMIERMDNRIWPTIEDCWCVDCGLSLPKPMPSARIYASSATGLGAISGVENLIGGSGYSAGTTAAVVDDDGTGPGAGAVPTLTIVAGVITAITFAPGQRGSKYTYPALVISDPANTGSGASADLLLDNTMNFATSLPAFSAGDVGSVIRMGGGIANVTAFTDSMHVTADMIVPIVQLLPNSGDAPLSQPAGAWTMTKPVTKISGLRHLAGLSVTGLADGNEIPPTVVDANGEIQLPVPASSVIVGLGFQAQLQGVYLETGEPTIQGQRKKIGAVTMRVESSRGMKVGTNQVDGSTLSPPQLAPVWHGLADLPQKARAPYKSRTQPLYTGDVRVPVNGGFGTPGQVAAQQDLPFPMQILAYIPEVFGGDTPQVKWPDRQGKGGQ